eukprot:1160273-Pelagomonas_calceolata.AAC.6
MEGSGLQAVRYFHSVMHSMYRHNNDVADGLNRLRYWCVGGFFGRKNSIAPKGLLLLDTYVSPCLEGMRKHYGDLEATCVRKTPTPEHQATLKPSRPECTHL